MKHIHPHRLFVQGNLIQLGFTLLTFLYVCFFDPQLPVMTALIILSIGTMGLVNPNGFAVYISYFDKLSGSASSLSAMVLLAMGAFVGALIGFFKDGTLMPFALGMLVCTLISNFISLRMPRPTGDFRKDTPTQE